MPRVLLLLPTTTYRAPDFLAAAARMNVEVVAATEKPNVMARHHPDKFLTIDFADLQASTQAAREFHRKYPVDAVIPVDDETAVVAAAIGSALSLKHNSIESVRVARDKYLLAEMLTRHGVQAPRHELYDLADNPADLAAHVSYPCVLKPRHLSGSRGVIRADDPSGFVSAWDRVAAILGRDAGGPDNVKSASILVQEYIAGPEFALEGLLSKGTLRVLALFDKPDPLEGPYFEETLYVTPSRLPVPDQKAIEECVVRSAAAIGLIEGPVHAEARLNSGGAWPIEVAARSIGGLCSRALRFGTRLSLEEIILNHALDRPVETEREREASGVMMIPIPSGGILRNIKGLAEARAEPCVVEVTITARLDNRVVPLPEGSSYLGFIFARAEAPELVETALRRAHGSLRFEIEPE
jgi:biotin carboxylase